jgi:hypothetical protein
MDFFDSAENSTDLQNTEGRLSSTKARCNPCTRLVVAGIVAQTGINTLCSEITIKIQLNGSIFRFSKNILVIQ